MKKENPSKVSTLRQKAEEQLEKKLSKTSSKLSQADLLKILHERDVSQIELEMQNEELKLAKELADIRLAIANKELLYQNEEKHKRADELVIINEQLYSAEQRAKQVRELFIANEGLRQTKHALHETNEYLESLINHANAPIMVWNRQLHIQRFNNAFELLTGWSESEVMGKSPEFLFSPSNVEHIMALLKKAATGERGESVEIEILHRDKSQLTVLWNSATVFEDDGRTPIATIVQGQDITRQKHVEQQQLSLSEHNLKERIKELNGLLSLSMLTESSDKIEDIYSKFLNSIAPASMQFPEYVYASLEIEGIKYCNIENFNLPVDRGYLSAPIILNGKQTGELIVAYTEELPLVELFEQNLITHYAFKISRITELYNLRRKVLSEKT